MKKLFLIIALFTSTDRLYAQATASTDDQEAIKNIITAETAAYAKRDSALLISFYADDPVTQSAWNSPDGNYGQFKGLQAIKKNFGDAFRANPDTLYQLKVERYDWFFRPLGEEWMWVNFTQKMTTVDGKSYTNYESRVMKRETSGWKIAIMYALSDHGKK